MSVIPFKRRKMSEMRITETPEGDRVPWRSHVNNWIGLYIAAALSVLVGLAGWTASQFVSIRDSVQALQERVPVQLESINSRLTIVERRMDTQDTRLYEMERKN